MTNTDTVLGAGISLKNKLEPLSIPCYSFGMGYYSEKDIELEATKLEQEQMEFEFWMDFVQKVQTDPLYSQYSTKE